MERKVVDHLYQTFKEEILTEPDAEVLLKKAEDFGLFCWSHYPGMYTDQKIEEKLSTAMLPPSDWKSTSTQKHYVYIATRLFAVGGHSRCILHFIDNFTEATHSVILLDQKKALPENLQTFFDQHRTNVIKNVGVNFTSKANSLRDIIKTLNPSRIFLFTHPNDLLPLITFGKFHPCQISLFNHADHTFWIGGKWIDSIIDFRSPGMAVTKQSRLLNRSELLLLPVDHSYENIPKAVAKKALGLSPEIRIVGTLTNVSKVLVEENEHSFADFLLSRAMELPAVQFMIVGLSDKDFISLLKTKSTIPSNITCLGVVTDPDKYFRAFDYFIEPFPIASPLGMLDACKFGAFPVFSPHAIYLAASYEALHASVSAICKRSGNQEEFLSHFMEAIHFTEDELKEKSEKIMQIISEHHRGKGWTDTLDNQQLLQINMEETPQLDPLKEMLFFQHYVKKTSNELFEYLFQLKSLVSKKVLLSFFFGKNKLFSFTQLSKRNYKLLAWKLVKG